MMHIRPRHDMAPMAKPYKKYELFIPLGIFIFGLSISLICYFYLVILPAQSEKIVLDAPGKYDLTLPDAGSYKLVYELENDAPFGWFPGEEGEPHRLYARIEDAATGEPMETLHISGTGKNGSLAAFHIDKAGSYTLTLDAVKEPVSCKYTVMPVTAAAQSFVYRFFTATLLCIFCTAFRAKEAKISRNGTGITGSINDWLTNTPEGSSGRPPTESLRE